MPITINGTGTIAGISVGGLENGCVNEADLATAAVTNTKLASASVTSDKLSGIGMVLSTAQNSTSGTAIDFTGIPSWVKRVTVMFNGVSTNGSSSVEIRLGTSAGIQATGYSTYSFSVTSPSTVAYATSTTGVRAAGVAATDSRIGSIVFTHFGSNTWTANGVTTSTTAQGTVCNNSQVSLSDTLTQLRITTVNGTDTFDAGSINILYEG